MDEDRERLEQTARTSVIWGEDVRTVERMLRANGLDDDEARAMICELKREREAAVREIGVRQMIFGGSLIALPVAYWVVSSFAGFFHTKILGLTVAVGLFGLWKATDGAIKFFAPSRVDGSVADMEG